MSFIPSPPTRADSKIKTQLSADTHDGRSEELEVSSVTFVMLANGAVTEARRAVQLQRLLRASRLSRSVRTPTVRYACLHLFAGSLD